MAIADLDFVVQASNYQGLALTEKVVSSQVRDAALGEVIRPNGDLTEYVAAVAVTSVTDNAGTAVFNFTPGPTLTNGQKVTLSGFAGSPTYNGVGVVANASAGTFETGVVFDADDTGSFTSGTSIATNDNLRIVVVADAATQALQLRRVRISADANTGQRGEGIVTGAFALELPSDSGNVVQMVTFETDEGLFVSAAAADVELVGGSN